MTDMIALVKFGGEIPNVPAHLLPDNFAQQAINCDFSQGRLRPLRQGWLLTTMAAAVKTIYTEDGINFYTWPTETQVFKSPVLRDQYNRVYYLDSGVLRVTTTAGMTPAGGPPTASWKVGVPAPTLAPALTVTDRNTFPDYPTATVAITTWLESAGKRYQEAEAAVTTVTALREYTFNVPARDTQNTPEDVTARAQFRFIQGSAFMTVTLGPTDGEVRSQALPGGVTLSMQSTSGLTHKITLTYGVVETRAYVYTNLNSWNEESGPSPASTIQTTYLQDVQVGLTASSFTDYRPFTAFRTYRTTGSNPAYLRVQESSSASFADTTHKAADFGDVLETLSYGAPPALLDGLVRLPGGILVGFKGTMLYMSEPYRPHAWGYEEAFAKSIRGLLVMPQALLVTTADGCHLVVGAHPSQMQPMQLPVPQAGIAMRSMANLDGMAVFASNDGIVTVNGSQASLAQSQRLFTREKWQERYSSILGNASMRFAWHDGSLVATSSTHPLGFLIRFDELGAGLYTQFNVQMDATFQLPVADALYYSQGANIYQFSAGEKYSFTWWSREYTWHRHRSLGAGYIRCSGSVTLTVYADGVQVFTGAMTTGHFRLPGGVSARRWSVKLAGTGEVDELFVARTMRELQRV